jgi:hypothetical protein
MAKRSGGGGGCNYFVIPCCFWDFGGKFTRLDRAVGRYQTYLNYIKSIVQRGGGGKSKIDGSRGRGRGSKSRWRICASRRRALLRTWGYPPLMIRIWNKYDSAWGCGMRIYSTVTRANRRSGSLVKLRKLAFISSAEAPPSRKCLTRRPNCRRRARGGRTPPPPSTFPS